MNRDEKLKVIQEAHDKWVESFGDEDIPEAGESEYGDANQFGVDIHADPDKFVTEVEEGTADEEPGADLTKAVEGLEALLAILKKPST